MWLKSFIVVFVMLFLGPASAQVTSDACVKLADTIAAGYSVSFSDKQFEAARYFANCEATQSNSGGGLNIGYAAFSLGAKYDEAKKRDYCSKSFDSYNIKSTEYNSVKIIFTQALATIDKCLEAAAKGWAIRYEQITKDSVSLNVSNGGSSGGQLLGIDIIPAGALTCEPGLPASALVITSTAPFATTCTRTPVTQVVDGITTSSAKEAVLNLRLSDGPFPIKLPEYSSSILDGINKRIDAVRADIAAQVEQLRGNLKKSGSGSINVINSRDATCGEGEYLVGFFFNDQPGLGHGALWGPQARCRKLSLGPDPK
jgi:hypothetical protein